MPLVASARDHGASAFKRGVSRRSPPTHAVPASDTTGPARPRGTGNSPLPFSPDAFSRLLGAPLGCRPGLTT